MAKRIPQHKIDEIYNAADVVEVLGEYLQLKKRGSNYFALSPFSNEKTPSFAISPTKNIWKDFSTGKGGNAVSYLMEAEGMSYVESLKYLAEKYNIDLEMEETPEDYIREDRRESLYILNEFAAKFFNEKLLEGEGRKIGYSYFKERGILESTIASFQLGYSPEAWDAFAKAAKEKQFTEEYLVETGLCFKSDRDGKLLDRYRGRIMFPILNHLGKVVGFGGRVLGNKKKMAKYVNSPESEIYSKSYILYGLYQSRKAIRDLDRSILVEGYMDVIALHQAGIENVVASSGTALTKEQIRLLKRFSKNVLLIYDADRAGINAALRGIDLLLEYEMSVRVLLLPEGEDPDSYVKAHGKSGFDAYVSERSQDFIDFKLNHLATSLDWSDPQQKTTAIHEIASTIAKIPDEVKRDVYLDIAAQKLSIGLDTMKSALARSTADLLKMQQREQRREQARKQQQQPTLLDPSQGAVDPSLLPRPDIPEEDGPPTGLIAPPIAVREHVQERELIRLILNYYDRELSIEEETYPLLGFLELELGEMEFESKTLENFRKAIFKEYSEKQGINLNFFLNHEDRDIAGTASMLVTIPYEISENWEKFGIKTQSIDEDLEESVFSALMHFKMHRVMALLEENRKELQAAKEEEQIDALLRINIHLEGLRRDICRELGIVV